MTPNREIQSPQPTPDSRVACGARHMSDIQCTIPPHGNGQHFNEEHGVAWTTGPAARPTPDSRVELLAAYLAAQPVVDDDLHLPMWAARSVAQAKIEEVEAAHLVLFDPQDPAVVERVAETVYITTRFVVGNGGWDHLDDHERSQWRARARAVLAALAAPGGVTNA